MAKQLELAVPHAFLDEAMNELTSLRCYVLFCKAATTAFTERKDLVGEV
jgi:hypothetical protein